MDDYAELVSDNDTLTLSLWWQPQYDADADWPDPAYLFDLSDGTNTNRVSLEFDDDDDKYNIYVNGAWRFQSTEQTFDAQEWQCVVLVLDFSSDVYALYVNGLADATDSTTLTAPSGMDRWGLGSDYGGTSQANAAFAEFAVFDRILAADEVAAVYAGGRTFTDSGAFVLPVDNLGSNSGSWPILGHERPNNGLTYNAVYMTEFGWGAPVSGRLQLEVLMLLNSAATTGYSIIQWDDSGTWRDVAQSEVSHTGDTVSTLLRSVVFDLPSNERTYRLAAMSSDAGIVNIQKAMLTLTPGGLNAI